MTATNLPTTLPKADASRPKPISKKVRAALDALVEGTAKTVTDAAAHAGLSREHLSRELSRPHISEALRSKVVRRLAVASARAGYVKTELLDCDNQLVRDRAASFILGLVGVSPQTAPAAPPAGLTPGLQIVIIQGPATGPGAEPHMISVPPHPKPAIIDQ